LLTTSKLLTTRLLVGQQAQVLAEKQTLKGRQERYKTMVGGVMFTSSSVLAHITKSE